MGTSIAGGLGNTTGQSSIRKDFLRFGPGYCIPDDKMKEIADRLLLAVDPNLVTDIVRSETEPQDKTKFWYNLSTNEILYWSEPETAWVRTEFGNVLPALYERQLVGITADASGDASITVFLNNFKDARALLSIVPNEDPGADFRWWVSSQTDTQINVSLAGMTPTVTIQTTVFIHRTSSS